MMRSLAAALVCLSGAAWGQQAATFSLNAGTSANAYVYPLNAMGTATVCNTGLSASGGAAIKIQTTPNSGLSANVATVWTTQQTLTTDGCGAPITVAGAQELQAIVSVTGSGVVYGTIFATPQVATSGGTVNQGTAGASPWPIDPEGLKASFSTSGAFTPAATPTDILTLTGSATKTIRLRRVVFSTQSGSAGKMTLAINLHSSVDSGGTSANPGVAPHDSQNASATATVLQYSANPSTIGTVVAALASEQVAFPSSTNNSRLEYDWGAATDTQSIVLRGTSQQIALNLGGGTVPTGGVVAYTITWTEE